MPEKLNYVLQICHRTHDDLIDLIRGLEQKSFRVLREPEFRIDGVRKPDLIVIKFEKSLVVDAQVIGEQTILDLAHKRKVQYYSENISLRRAIVANNDTEEVSFFSIILSWRGVWSAKSVKRLLESGLMNKRDLKVVSSRVLESCSLEHFYHTTERLCERIAQHLRGLIG